MSTDLQRTDEIRRAMFAVVNSVTDSSTPEEWVETDGHVKALAALVREVSAAWKERFADRLDRLGDIEIGDKRLYAGKVTKWNRKAAPGELFDAALEAAGGDIDALKRCLSANWYKRSDLAELSQELHDLCFEREEVVEPKTGKPKREPRVTR